MAFKTRVKLFLFTFHKRRENKMTRNEYQLINRTLKGGETNKHKRRYFKVLVING